MAFAENVKKMHVKKGMPDVDLKSIAGAFVTRSMDEATTLREIMGFIVPPKEALDKSKKNIVGVWEWDMNGVWTEFNPSEQPVLEKAFQEFKKKGKTAAEVKFTIKAINKPYVANLYDEAEKRGVEISAKHSSHSQTRCVVETMGRESCGYFGNVRGVPTNFRYFQRLPHSMNHSSSSSIPLPPQKVHRINRRFHGTIKMLSQNRLIVSCVVCDL